VAVVACAIEILGVPDYVIQRIDQTRALDGKGARALPGR